MVLMSLLKYVKKTLNHHARTKQKFVRGKHLPFMNKTLSEAIMHSTRFCNEYLRNKTDKNKRKYTKQRNYSVSLLRKSNIEYYSSLDVKNITDNKTRGGSRAAATFKMEHFVIIVSGFQPLTVITKRSILDVAAALDPPLKTFWKAVKPFLLDNARSTQKITLIHNDKSAKNDDDTARVLNTNFSNIVSNLKEV